MPQSDGLKQVFSYDNLVHAVSGAVGSTFALSVFYPLDTARTRLQIQDHAKPQFSGKIVAQILREEGLESLYRGWYPVVTSLCCSNFVYFYVYNSLKAVLIEQGKPSNAVKDLLLAYIAGATNVLTTTPLWVVNTRLKIQGVRTSHHKKSDEEQKSVHYKGIADCFRRIVREEGVSQLWSGVSPSLVLALNPAIQWMVYEALKRYLQKKLGIKDLSGLAYFTGGAIAKMVATILTYPMQVVQTRLRAGHHQNNGKKNMKLLDLMRDIARTRGLLGMYKGLEAKLTQTVLMSALMFLTYEKIAAFVFSIMGGKYHSKAK